jgi:hypothetical protein
VVEEETEKLRCSERKMIFHQQRDPRKKGRGKEEWTDLTRDKVLSIVLVSSVRLTNETDSAFLVGLSVSFFVFLSLR